MIFNRIIAFFVSIATSLSLLFSFGGGNSENFGGADSREKYYFDEGELVVRAYDLFVSPRGNDSNTGTKEAPLKTLEGAKEALKAYKNLNITDTVTVWFEGGTYVFGEAVIFGADDYSGVLFRSIPGEEVVFSGSYEINNWKNGTINGIDCLVSEVDTENNYFRSLFKGEKRLPNSIWPKEGVFTVKNSLLSDALYPESEFFKLHAAFYANENEIMNFKNVEDVNVRIMHKWCDDILPLLSADESSGRVLLRKAAAMSVEIGDNYIYENVREAMSLAGEWYLDRAEGLLYYIPLEGENAENLVLQAPVTTALLDINGIDGISFQGIKFINTDWDFVSGTLNIWPTDKTNPLYNNLTYLPTHPQAAYEIPAAITVENAKNINFTDCIFRSISDTAVMFKGNVSDCSVEACLFDEIGANAVFINAPHALPAITKNITVRNCEIKEYGRNYNHSIGVLICHASDCVVEKNEIHDGWYTAVSVGWVWGYAENPTNNILVKDNLIYNIGNGWLSDMGGIYTLGIQPDTVLTGNVIHNVGCYEGSTGYGGWGIYLDEGSTEILVENNLVFDCSSQCFHQHYGKNNMIRNNIFAFGGEGAMRITRHEEHNSLFWENNILVSDDAVMYKDSTKEGWFKDNANLYFDCSRKLVYSGESTAYLKRLGIPCMVARGYYNNAVFADPLFKDIKNRDFTLSESSPALDMGFTPFSYNAGTDYIFD